MSINIPISFDVNTSDPAVPLGLTVRFDGAEVFNSAHITQQTSINIECSDDDGDHVLEIEMLGKLPEHTKINEAGEITQDAVLKLSNIVIDGINIEKIFTDVAEYTHNFNGHGDTVTERCYDTLGCNGIMRLKFTTPVYLWLLENM